MSAEPVPHGETGIELSAVDAFEAIHTALQDATKPASQRVTVRSIEPKKAGSMVLIAVSWKAGKVVHHATLRMAGAQARSFAARLDKVTGR